MNSRVEAFATEDSLAMETVLELQKLEVPEDVDVIFGNSCTSSVGGCCES